MELSDKVTILISIFVLSSGNEITKPNIILIIADDLGWNDVGFLGSNEIPTPNIDALGYHGAVLNRHYTQPVCSPSRAALMTGKYPIRTGLQGGPLRNAYPVCLPLNETILPQYLKKQGYVTRLVGKWHLGFYRKECTPNARGFDSFLGYYSGVVRYNDSAVILRGKMAFDARDNFKPAGDRFAGKYNTDVFTDEAIRIIRRHNKQTPLFLEISYTAVHGVWKNTLQVRNITETETKFSYIKNRNRRLFAGVLTALDESVGKIISVLEKQDMLRNSVILFISDNGAEVENHGSNFPLRGQKGTLLEGGVRGVAAIWSPFTEQNAVLNNFIHLTDWLPTFYAAAGGRPLNKIDGVNQWDYLRGVNKTRVRSEILVNIDEKKGNAALIKDSWKLIRSKNETVKYYPFEGLKWNPHYKIGDVLSSLTHRILSKYDKKAFSKNDLVKVRSKVNTEKLCELRLNQTNDEINLKRLPCFDTGCLFNLENDPCEFTDLSKNHPQKFTELQEKLKVFEGQLVKQWKAQPDLRSDPKNFCNYWTPWVL